MNEFILENLESDEIAVAVDAVIKLREEKRQKKLLEERTNAVTAAVGALAAVSTTPEIIRFLRSIIRELKE